MSDHENAAASPERIIIQSETDTVCLKQLVPEDGQLYFDLIAYDADHLRQHGDETADNYPDAAAVRASIEHPKNPEKYRFGIWDGVVMVGTDNLTPRGEARAELGSWVGKQHVGHSYASRARALLVSFAFDTLGLDEVYCDIVVGNEPSRQSVEKSGFTYSGEVVDHKGTHIWRYMLRRPESSQ